MEDRERRRSSRSTRELQLSEGILGRAHHRILRLDHPIMGSRDHEADQNVLGAYPIGIMRRIRWLIEPADRLRVERQERQGVGRERWCMCDEPGRVTWGNHQRRV